jgi:hypothetical protein
MRSPSARVARPDTLRAAQVTDEASGRVYSGRSPTHPWTQVCLAQRTGQRISGAPPGPLRRRARAAGLPAVLPGRTCLCPPQRTAAPCAPAGTLPHRRHADAATRGSSRKRACAAGPLFFGFSDPVTQRAIAALYTPDELAAALRARAPRRRNPPAAFPPRASALLRRPQAPAAPSAVRAARPMGASVTLPQGERAAVVRPAPEERCAAELRGVAGVGEATAVALACTAALGGRRHGSLASLRAWVAADGHAAALLAFLLHRRGPDPTRVTLPASPLG